MASKTQTLYLYLARRDKSSVRILGVVLGTEILPSRVESIDSLNLPVAWNDQVKKIVYDNRMLWELWIESADSYELLKKSLTTRGYSNLPMSGQPEFSGANYSTPTVNVSSLPTKTIMVRRQN
jgi:hypothetical protein